MWRGYVCAPPMPIQWYPGHMTEARRVMVETIPAHDVVIEVLDARLPRSSSNPIVSEVRTDKPRIKVLTKSDLADPQITAAWVRHFDSLVQPNPGNGQPPGRVAALAITTAKANETKAKLPALCKELALHPSGPNKTVRAIIVGVPNVGKSTLINTLMNRAVAKVGDEPAVTKSQQRVTLANGMTLSDNPGIMWPKIEDTEGGLRLAFAGSIPDSAIDYEEVGLWGGGYLLERYPDSLVTRYKLAAVPESASSLLHEIGKRRGGLRAGGVVDMHKAADALIHDFRSGALGRISLEEP